MNSATTRTIGDIAAQSISAVSMFEQHGIDYCCGGQRPLDEVCREKGIDPTALLEQIEAGERVRQTPDSDWASASLEDLIDHILSAHHAYLRRELPHIQQRMTAVLNAHGERHGEMLRRLARVFANLKAELEMHMQKEERILFPFVARAERSARAEQSWTPPPFGTVANPIHVMEHEHDSAGRALREMRTLTNEYSLPADACSTFQALYAGLADLERDLHLHIHLENNILFPRAMAIEPITAQQS